MVLIVDDDMMIVEVLRKWLERDGQQVEVCFNGKDAYDCVKDPRCRCVVLDVNMPVLNGIQLLLLMQAEGIRTPVVLMAGFKDFDEQEMGQFTNVVRFFQKPFSMEEMVAAVRDALRP